MIVPCFLILIQIIIAFGQTFSPVFTGQYGRAHEELPVQAKFFLPLSGERLLLIAHEQGCVVLNETSARVWRNAGLLSATPGAITATCVLAEVSVDGSDNPMIQHVWIGYYQDFSGRLEVWERHLNGEIEFTGISFDALGVVDLAVGAPSSGQPCILAAYRGSLTGSNDLSASYCWTGSYYQPEAITIQNPRSVDAGTYTLPARDWGLFASQTLSFDVFEKSGEVYTTLAEFEGPVVTLTPCQVLVPAAPNEHCVLAALSSNGEGEMYCWDSFNQAFEWYGFLDGPQTRRLRCWEQSFTGYWLLQIRSHASTTTVLRQCLPTPSMDSCNRVLMDNLPYALDGDVLASDAGRGFPASFVLISVASDSLDQLQIYAQDLIGQLSITLGLPPRNVTTLGTTVDILDQEDSLINSLFIRWNTTSDTQTLVAGNYRLNASVEQTANRTLIAQFYDCESGQSFSDNRLMLSEGAMLQACAVFPEPDEPNNGDDTSSGTPLYKSLELWIGVGFGVLALFMIAICIYFQRHHGGHKNNTGENRSSGRISRSSSASGFLTGLLGKKCEACKLNDPFYPPDTPKYCVLCDKQCMGANTCQIRVKYFCDQQQQRGVCKTHAICSICKLNKASTLGVQADFSTSSVQIYCEQHIKCNVPTCDRRPTRNYNGVGVCDTHHFCYTCSHIRSRLSQLNHTVLTSTLWLAQHHYGLCAAHSSCGFPNCKTPIEDLVNVLVMPNGQRVHTTHDDSCSVESCVFPPFSCAPATTKTDAAAMFCKRHGRCQYAEGCDLQIDGSQSQACVLHRCQFIHVEASSSSSSSNASRESVEIRCFSSRLPDKKYCRQCLIKIDQARPSKTALCPYENCKTVLPNGQFLCAAHQYCEYCKVHEKNTNSAVHFLANGYGLCRKHFENLKCPVKANQRHNYTCSKSPAYLCGANGLCADHGICHAQIQGTKGLQNCGNPVYHPGGFCVMHTCAEIINGPNGLNHCFERALEGFDFCVKHKDCFMKNCTAPRAFTMDGHGMCESEVGNLGSSSVVNGHMCGVGKCKNPSHLWLISLSRDSAYIWLPVCDSHAFCEYSKNGVPCSGKKKAVQIRWCDTHCCKTQGCTNSIAWWDKRLCNEHSPPPNPPRGMPPLDSNNIN